MPALSEGRFVILGGASQIGSHIGEQLLAAGARRVVLLDNLSLGTSDIVAPLLADKRCTLVRGDVLRLNELVDAVAGADGVFAVAALMASSIRDNAWVGLDVNVRGLQNALEACRNQRVKKVVFSSSAGVYGATEDALTTEDSPLRWASLPPAMALYCASKVIGESLARQYQERHGLDYVALRYTAVYGERQHQRAMVGGHIADTCLRLRSGMPALLDGDGSQVQDYVYAGDVAMANLLAMQSDVTGEAMNICSGVATSQRQIVEMVTRACGCELITEQRQPVGGAAVPPVRQAYSREKARRLLGWEPQVLIEQGVAKMLGWVDQCLAQTAKASAGDDAVHERR